MASPVLGFRFAEATDVMLITARTTIKATAKRFTIQNPFLPRWGTTIFAVSENMWVKTAA